MSIEAMKLALVALEDVDGANQLGWWARSKAITAIKQALAAPVQEEDLYDLAVKADNIRRTTWTIRTIPISLWRGNTEMQMMMELGARGLVAIGG